MNSLNPPQKLSREELINKLHNKINKLHDERYKPSAQQMNKIEKEMKLEKKLNDNDPRVTQLMKDYFIHAMKTYPTQNILDPHSLLENEDEYKLKFLNFCIKLLKKSNNDLDILKNPYCNYMREVFSMNQ
jgi:hypothetical protein